MTSATRYAALLACLLLAACGGGDGGKTPVDPIPTDTTSLRTRAAALARPIGVGTAVGATFYGTGTITDTYRTVLAHEFSVVTAENVMKFSSLRPTRATFNYAAGDALVAFAAAHGMKVRGHTLVWHSQNPSWVFSGTKDDVLKHMRNHITNVMKHFAGKVYAWDVVNEAIMEDGSYRDGTLADDKKSQWYAILGESYIAEAFKAARAADPNAKLFYNDFYDYIPAKQQGIYNMVKKLKDQGVPIDGIGMQCHLNIEPSTMSTNQAYYQDVAHLEDAIKLYASLGVDVQVTEMDVSLYIPGITYTQDTFYTLATFTDALKAKQAQRYRDFFELFRKYKGTITGVTLWGIADDNTWLSEFSSGRKDFPLLFDTNHNPKPAYSAVVDF